ncbi:MAG: prephenate dehydratase [Pirellulaceae bacterium]|nr:prephenate dehydratase [Pirellulaceae bacterium]
MNKTSSRTTCPTSKSLADRLIEIDRQMLKLLADRIGLLRSTERPVDLEEQRRALIQECSDVGPAHLLSDWLNHASSLSARQAWPKRSVAYLGPLYSFSYLAAAKYFGMGADLVDVASISAAFEEVARKHTAFAVVPIENSTDGRIVDTLGMFARTPLQICGEILLPIHHCLLARGSRQQLREVHSKPQALSQCRNWLATHLPQVKLVEVASTALAAANAAANEQIAAIASREAGIHHGCQMIAENIEDNSQNVTRFAIIGQNPCAPTGNDKTSLMFELGHHPGALADAMMVFKSAAVNLTWIESFPLPNRPNEYLFFVELEGHQDTESVRLAIEKLRAMAPRLEMLGSYPKGRLIET